MNRHAGRAPRRRTRRRHDHPQLGKAPGLVHEQLARPRVGRVVHFEHDVGKVLLADDQGPLRGRGARRVQVQRLVGLHRAPGPAVGALPEQGHRSVRGDRRAADRGDAFGQMRQPPRGPFVDAVVVGDHPGGFDAGVPVLDPALEVLEPIPEKGHAAAAGEPQRLVAQGLAALPLRDRADGRSRPAAGTHLQIRLVHRSIIACGMDVRHTSRRAPEGDADCGVAPAAGC